MHWIELEGCKVPVRIGGHPALDFCNTWAGWGEAPDPRGEWLRDYEHLAVWALHAGLVASSDVRRLRLSSRRHSDRAARVLSEARRLRTAAHTVALDPNDKPAMAVVTRYVRRSSAVVRLTPGDVPRWEFGTDAGLDLPLLATAWAVGELVTREDLTRVRCCPGHECGWLFLDASGRRKWCSMQSCGNRAKVASFARRRQGG
jgi:predicted RNA-binding Zn ribbon-like protein